MDDRFNNTTPVLSQEAQAAPRQEEPTVGPMLGIAEHTAAATATAAYPGPPVSETAEPGPPVEAPAHFKGDQKPELSNAAIHGGRSVIGLDVGTRTLKIVHIQTSGSGIRLVDAVITDLPPKSDPDRFEAISAAVAQLLASARPRVKTVCCAMSGEGVATICCSLPKMGEKDLAQAVQWKLAETASVETERSTTGYYTLSGSTKSGSLDIVAAAVRNDLDKLETLFHTDSPRLAVVISEPLAAENIVTAAYHAQERGPVAVLDIGSTSANLSVIGELGLEFTRELPVGGDAVTAALAGKMTLDNDTVEISRQVAERVKKEYTIGQANSVEAAGIVLPAGRILGAIRPVLERLASEVVRSLQFYAQTHNLARVENLFICGGGATLGGLAGYFSKETRVPTALLDPWHMLGFEVAADIKVDPALFAVATGAAIHDGGKVNLLPPRIRARRTIFMIRTSSLIASACALFALVGLSWTAAQQRSELRNIVHLKQEATTPMEELAAKITVAREHKAELNRRRQIFRSLGVGRPIHAALLKELSNIMPEGTYLRSLSFNRTNGVRRMRLVVDIYAMPSASSNQLKQQLIAALENSPFFVNVSFLPATARATGGTRAPDEMLELTCQVLGFPGD